MKKGAYKIPENLKLGLSQKSKDGGEQKKKALKPAQSEEVLFNRPKKIVPQRKASTPTHDRSTASVSPDISCIMPSEKKLVNSSNVFNKEVIQKKTQKGKITPKTIYPKETDLKEELGFEYTRYLQSVFRSKLEKAKVIETDENLAKVQRRIAENEKILHKTTERLKNISFNQEIDLLHNLNSPNYTKVLETLDNSNCEKDLSTLYKNLEQSHNQLMVKNIELPKGGGEQLMEVISETVEALEKLKTDHDVETPKLITEIKDVTRSSVNALSKCKENLPNAESLLLTRTTLEISTRDKI